MAIKASIEDASAIIHVEVFGAGPRGSDGKDGLSPSVSIIGTDDGHNVVITDKTGPHEFHVKNGVDGANGAVGESGVFYGDTEPEDPDIKVWIDPSGSSEPSCISPTISTEAINGGTRVTITDKNGSKTVDLMNGKTPTIQIGTVETLEPWMDATATITGETENPMLNLGIPSWKDGMGEVGFGGPLIDITTEEEIVYIEQDLPHSCTEVQFLVLTPLPNDAEKDTFSFYANSIRVVAVQSAFPQSGSSSVYFISGNFSTQGNKTADVLCSDNNNSWIGAYRLARSAFNYFDSSTIESVRIGKGSYPMATGTRILVWGR